MLTRWCKAGDSIRITVPPTADETVLLLEVTAGRKQAEGVEVKLAFAMPEEVRIDHCRDGVPRSSKGL